MTRRGFPHLGKMKRTLCALRRAGEQLERIEVDGDRFTVVLAKKDTPAESADDPVHEDHAA